MSVFGTGGNQLSETTFGSIFSLEDSCKVGFFSLKCIEWNFGKFIKNGIQKRVNYCKKF